MIRDTSTADRRNFPISTTLACYVLEWFCVEFRHATVHRDRASHEYTNELSCRDQLATSTLITPESDAVVRCFACIAADRRVSPRNYCYRTSIVRLRSTLSKSSLVILGFPDGMRSELERRLLRSMVTRYPAAGVAHNMVFTLGLRHTFACLATRAGIGTIFRSSDIVRFV